MARALATKRLFSFLGLDHVLLLTVLSHVISIIVGPISLFVVGTFMSQVEQGYYYTFSSLITLQSFLELGFSQAIVHIASHEFGSLQFGSKGNLEGDMDSKSRLLSLLKLAVKWYAVIAVLIVTVVGAVGYYFFNLKDGNGVHWVAPWWGLCVATAINVILLPVYSFLEGCNQYLWVAVARIVTRLLASLVFCTSIIGGFGLIAGCYSVLIGTIAFVIMFCVRWKNLLKDLIGFDIVKKISWKEEIMPFQWRIALGWICGYFIFNFFAPVLFQYQGPIIAGQMGMTLIIMNSIGNVSSSWINIKTSVLGGMVSKRNWKSLDSIWLKSTIQSLLLVVLASVFFVLCFLLFEKEYKIFQRFLDIKCIIVLCVAFCLNQLIYCQNLYMRSFKKEPFLLVFIANAILTGSSIFLSAKYYTVLEVCCSFAVFICLSLICTSIIFSRKRKAWTSVA